MQEIISIIIPIYNIDKYLERCLESIKNQKYNNLEVLLIDDGSKDNSKAICKKFINIDTRFKYFFQTNKGVSCARNLGLKNYSGEYVLFIDGDDSVDENYVYDLYNCIKKYDADIVISHPIICRQDRQIKISKIEQDIVCNKETAMKYMLEDKYFHSTIWGKLIKGNVINNTEFEPKLTIGEDFKFLHDLILNCNKIIISNISEYYYYENEDSTVRKKINDGWIKQIEMCKDLINQNKNKALEMSYKKRYINSNMDCAVRFKLNREQHKMIKRNMKEYINELIQDKDISMNFKIKMWLIAYNYFIFKILFSISRKLRKNLE